MKNDELTLLIRGGTIASGHRVVVSYADLLTRALTEKKITVINRSHRGDNSFDAVWTFDEDISPFDPDIIIFHYGIDDAFFPVYRSEFKENMVQVIRKSRLYCDPIIILLTSHIFPNQYDMDAVNIYYRTIREVSADLQCIMIPVHTIIAGQLLEKNINIDEIILEDDRYLNERGHALFADIIMRYLENIITKEQ